MVYPFQPSFAGGEISPSLQGRVDLAKLNTAAQKMENMFCHAQGGVSNRPGTYYIGNLADTEHKLISFQFSITQAYCLAFTNLKMFVMYDGGIVQSGTVDYYLTTPYPTSALDELRFVQSADTLYVVHPDYAPRKITRTAHNAWSIAEISFDGPWMDPEDMAGEMLVPESGAGGGKTEDVSITSTAPFFTAAMAAEGRKLRFGYASPLDASVLQWSDAEITDYTSATQVKVDLLDGGMLGFIYNYNPRFQDIWSHWVDASDGTATVNIERGYAVLNNGAGDTAILQQNYIPVIADTEIVLRISVDTWAIGGVPTATFNVGTTPGAADIATGSAGTGTIVFTPAVSAICISLEYSNTTPDLDLKVLKLWVNDEFPIVSTLDWKISNFDGSGRYPSQVSFFEQRLVAGGSDDYPQTNHHSMPGDYENFSFETPLLESDTIEYTLAARGVNAIRWMIQLKDLVVGTAVAEWRISSGTGVALSPTAILAKVQSEYGSAKHEPIVIGDTIIFVARGARKVVALNYSTEANGYLGNELTIMAEHLFEDGTIIDWAFQSRPNGIIWCVLSDGTLKGLTYNPSQQVFGWHKHVTDGSFESVAVVEGDETDDVYFVVNRTIETVEKKYVELLMPRITDADANDMFFVDSGLTYSGTATVTISRLDHLEGETVSILADGGVIPQQEVSGGEITLTKAASLVHVGLPYTSDFQSLDLELNANDGTTQGRLKTVPRVVFKVKDTRSFFSGPSFDDSDLVETRMRDQEMGYGAITLFTGEKTTAFQSGFGAQMNVCVRNTDPLPVTILAIIPEFVLSESDDWS